MVEVGCLVAHIVVPSGGLRPSYAPVAGTNQFASIIAQLPEQSFLLQPIILRPADAEATPGLGAGLVVLRQPRLARYRARRRTTCPLGFGLSLPTLGQGDDLPQAQIAGHRACDTEQVCDGMAGVVVAPILERV